MCDLLSARLHLLPPFRWRLVEVPFGISHPFWIEDPDFDLEYHVRELALPEPGDDPQLAEQVARIHARPLDRSRPLWECYVIHGLAGERVGVMTKIHHAAVDGMSGAEILTTLLDMAPEGRDLPAPSDTPQPEAMPGQLQMLGRGLAGLPRERLATLARLPAMLPNLDAIPGVNLLPGSRAVSSLSRRAARLVSSEARDGGVLQAPSPRPPRTPLNGPISQHRRFAFASLSLSDVKRVKNQLGLSVNDVVMAMCTGALRAWLIEHDGLPDRPLVAQIPVSVRTPEQLGTFGNRVSVMGVPLPTDEPDPTERVRRIHTTMLAAKERHRAVPASLLQDVTRFIPPALFARASRVTLTLTAGRGLAPTFNVVISNVPGSREPLYMGGAPLLANYPVSVILDGIGLNITVLSYRDQLDFGIVADRDQVENAWPMIAGLREALDELLTLVPSKGATPKPSPRAPSGEPE